MSDPSETSKRDVPEVTPLQSQKKLKTALAEEDGSESLSNAGCHDRDPWSVYEPKANITLGRPLTLACHRAQRNSIVNIQSLATERSKVLGSLETIRRLSHPTFLALIESYYYRGQLYLVWEPMELSLQGLLSAHWPLSEAHLGQIVRPTLDGIKFLRDQGRALAVLGAETILLNEGGEVRVVGVENSCELHTLDMNADTLKLTALKTVMTNLMAQSGDRSWSSDITNFVRDLTSMPLDELLRHSFCMQASDAEGLKMCVYVADKIAGHNAKLLNRVELRRMLSSSHNKVPVS